MAKPLKKDPVAEATVAVSDESDDESIYEQMSVHAKPVLTGEPLGITPPPKLAVKPPAHAVTGATALKVLPPSVGSPPAKAQALPAWSTPPLRTQKLHFMVGELAATALGNGAGSAVLPFHVSMQDWNELVAIQQAILTRCGQQYGEWVEGLQQIAADYNQIRAANTVSKYAEQECNVAAQFQALVSNQWINWVGLVENIHVDYAYWLSQKRSAVLSGPWTPAQQ